MKTPYLLFILSPGIAICVLLSIHLVYKPASQDWAYYDPNFVFALKESPSELGEYACKPDTVFGVGSSTLDAAVAQEDGNWLRWNRWRRYLGPMNDTQNVAVIVRTATIDLRILHPVLALLPDCKKIVLIGSDILLTQHGSTVLSRTYLTDLLFTAPQHFLGSRVDQLFPIDYQLPFHVAMKHRKSSIENRDPLQVMAQKRKDRLRKSFNELRLEHVAIFERLIENQADIVILDIARSSKREEGLKEGLDNFREVVESYAIETDAIHYWHFPALDSTHYGDGSHMNNKGAEVFRSWLANKVTALRGDAVGLR